MFATNGENGKSHDQTSEKEDAKWLPAERGKPAGKNEGPMLEIMFEVRSEPSLRGALFAEWDVTAPALDGKNGHGPAQDAVEYGAAPVGNGFSFQRSLSV